jgi:hypothetical protein
MKQPEKWFDTDNKGCKTRLVWMDGKGNEDWYRWEYQETPGGEYLLAGLVDTADWLGGLTEQEKQWAKSNAKKREK